MVGVENFKDAAYVPTDEDKAKMKEYIVWLESDFYTNTSAMLNSGFHPKTDTVIKQLAQKEWAKADSVAAIAGYKDCLLEYPDKLNNQPKKMDQTLYLINSFDDEYPSPTDTTMLNETGISYELHMMAGTGYNPMMEQPLYFNRVLEQVLQNIKKGDGI